MINRMIAINKEEKEAIRKLYPHVHIVRTMKQKSKRHRYYCEESRSVMRYLDKVRNANIVASKSKEGGRYTDRKER